MSILGIKHATRDKEQEVLSHLTRGCTNKEIAQNLSSCLGWPQEKIAKLTGTRQNRISQIINNTNFGEIDNLLSQGHDMEYIARHYHMDLPLVWALRLEGKTDQEKFSELGWC